MTAAAPAIVADRVDISRVLDGSDADEATVRLAGLLEVGFLEQVGWDPVRRLLLVSADHPQLGWRACQVEGCLSRVGSKEQICRACRDRLTRHGLSDSELHKLPPPRAMRPMPCSVPGCARLRVSSRPPLCQSHHRQQQQILQLPLREFLVHPQVAALPGFGRCQVSSCPRERNSSQGPYCTVHKQRWRRAVLAGDAPVEQVWRSREPAPPEAGQASLRGLPARVVVEILFGLQQRSRRGVNTAVADVRAVGDELRRLQLASVDQLPTLSKQHQRRLAISIAREVATASLHPETEKSKDVWDMAAFGLTGRLVFTAISQRWLREAAKQWATHDLPRRRGVPWYITTSVQGYLHCIARLSESLRLRPDHGNIPAELSRSDMDSFLQRLAYLATTAQISEGTRARTCRKVKGILNSIRALGLTRSDGAAAGLPEDFSLTVADIPATPESPEPGRDLPPEIMQQLCAQLPALETMSGRHIRIAVELLIDTGRRPREICTLPWDCLRRDDDGKPVLIYDNHKSNRMGRRLPIPEQTAALITEQKTRVRSRFPDTPLAELKLLPSPTCNPHGRRNIREISVSGQHRDWVDGLPPLMLDDGTEFDRSRAFPYAYRHTYAQRHADAGVPADVLRVLMDHRMFETTKQYYRVGEKRRREAIDRVTVMQFDRHGNRIWRQAQALLDSEHARRAIGEVVVPFGVCAEPSNVKAGGHACPYRFRCVGCDHFRTDVSYLPDLNVHLDDLLRNRERLRAATDVDAWARAEALPSDEEITRVRRLISRIKSGLDDLTGDERKQIDQAVAVVRRHRTTTLGMPLVRQPLPDLRPQRGSA